MLRFTGSEDNYFSHVKKARVDQTASLVQRPGSRNRKSNHLPGSPGAFQSPGRSRRSSCIGVKTKRAGKSVTGQAHGTLAAPVLPPITATQPPPHVRTPPSGTTWAQAACRSPPPPCPMVETRPGMPQHCQRSGGGRREQSGWEDQTWK